MYIADMLEKKFFRLKDHVNAEIWILYKKESRVVEIKKQTYG